MNSQVLDGTVEGPEIAAFALLVTYLGHGEGGVHTPLRQMGRSLGQW